MCPYNDALAPCVATATGLPRDLARAVAEYIECPISRTHEWYARLFRWSMLRALCACTEEHRGVEFVFSWTNCATELEFHDDMTCTNAKSERGSPMKLRWYEVYKGGFRLELTEQGSGRALWIGSIQKGTFDALCSIRESFRYPHSALSSFTSLPPPLCSLLTMSECACQPETLIRLSRAFPQGRLIRLCDEHGGQGGTVYLFDPKPEAVAPMRLRAARRINENRIEFECSETGGEWLGGTASIDVLTHEMCVWEWNTQVHWAPMGMDIETLNRINQRGWFPLNVSLN